MTGPKFMPALRSGVYGLALATLLALARPAFGAADDPMPEGIRQHPAVAAADWDQTIEIVIELGDHHYEPDELTLKVGQPYKLTLKNIGQVAHDMVGGSFFDERVIALRMVNSRVGRVMADHINSIYVRARNDSELWLIPLEAGEYTFFCSLPGHRDGGMEGVVRIEP